MVEIVLGINLIGSGLYGGDRGEICNFLKPKRCVCQFFRENASENQIKGGQLARAAGAVAKLIAKEGKSATLKLPSGEVRLISKNCPATVGQVGNVGVNQKSLGRAESKCWLGKRPVVRGVVMNPVDHPHGGGEGRAPVGRKKPV